MVTEAPQSRAADMAHRERRYLVMMGIRLVCFVITVVMVVNHLGWFAVIPAAGSIFIPYFAVILANSSRLSGRAAGFTEYQPRLPERYSPPQPPPSPRDSDSAPGPD